jgi:hypothetical protein
VIDSFVNVGAPQSRSLAAQNYAAVIPLMDMQQGLARAASVTVGTDFPLPGRVANRPPELPAGGRLSGDSIAAVYLSNMTIGIMWNWFR